MQREIFVNVGPTEVRVAIFENRDLVEFMVERKDQRRIVGDVYKGIVRAVLPGIQAAFVDIGMEKAGFLHVSDLASESAIPQDVETDDGGPARGGRGRRRDHSKLPPIEKLVKKGDEIVVQVAKEPIGTKGARLTAHLSLAGKFCVLMPDLDYVGVSRKILDRKERSRLRRVIQQARPKGCAVIVRTAGEGEDEEQIKADIDNLSGMNRQIQDRARGGKAPALLRQDLGMIPGLVRDLFDEEVKRLIIDDEQEYEELIKYVSSFAPELERRVIYWREQVPLFDHFGIEAKIEKNLGRQIWLRKGGQLTIDHTEALVSIDVNTGKYVGKRNQAETILATNLLAAKEIPRQLRLRDIGGIIVIDFIDMEKEDDRRKVYNELRNAMRTDRARTKVFEVSPLGLVEMSRKRVRPSLLHFFSEECPFCRGTGHVQTVETLSSKLEGALRRIASRCRERKYQIRVNPVLAHYLRSERLEILREIEGRYKVALHILEDPRLHREHHEVTSLETGRDLIAAVSQ